MVIFVIKNIRDRDIVLGPHKLKPGEEFSIEQLNPDINAAGVHGDISVTVTHENSKVDPPAKGYSTKEL